MNPQTHRVSRSGFHGGQLGKAQPVASNPNAQFGPNWSYMGKNSAGLPEGKTEIPDGSYGVGLYTPVGGGEIEVEIKNGEAVGGKLGIGAGAGGHFNVGTKSVGTAQIQGPVGGYKSEPIKESDPSASSTIRIGSSISASVGVGTVGVEVGGSVGMEGDSASKNIYSSGVAGNITVSPVLPKIQGEIKVNIIEISVTSPEGPEK